MVIDTGWGLPGQSGPREGGQTTSCHCPFKNRPEWRSMETGGLLLEPHQGGEPPGKGLVAERCFMNTAYCPLSAIQLISYLVPFILFNYPPPPLLEAAIKSPPPRL